MIKPEILQLIRKHSKIYDSLHHGVAHWKTVERNGLYLADFTGADSKVVSHFAWFHDCMRENEYDDPEHGPRAARLIKKYRNKLDLTDSQYNDLLQAVSGHTFGRKAINLTIATCWDADRLDIGRVGIPPHSKYLFSDEAKRIADEDDEQVLYRFGFVTEVY